MSRQLIFDRIWGPWLELKVAAQVLVELVEAKNDGEFSSSIKALRRILEEIDQTIYED